MNVNYANKYKVDIVIGVKSITFYKMGKYTTIQITKELRDDIKNEAKNQKRTVSGLVERVMEQYLNKQKRLPSKTDNILRSNN
jgi:uncharacterized protein YebE (UPF0316 family)